MKIRDPISGTIDGKPPFDHKRLKALRKGLGITNDEVSKGIARRLFGRLAEEPEIKKFMKEHFIIETCHVDKA